MRPPDAVHEDSDNLILNVYAQGLRERRTGHIERGEHSIGNEPAMIHHCAIDVEPANVAEIVDAGGLRAIGRLRDRDYLKNTAEFEIDVWEVRRGVVHALAVIAYGLTVVIDSQELV